MIVTTSLELSIETILKMIKARWHIENCTFNNLKNNAELDHCYVHGKNAVEAVVCILFISSNLFHLFRERRTKNQVPIQKELARLLLKGLYLLKHDDDLIFNTG